MFSLTCKAALVQAYAISIDGGELLFFVDSIFEAISHYCCRYGNLGDLDLPLVKSQPVNAGMAFDFQFVNVEDCQGKGEFSPAPYFYQNLGEAEYVVALYVSQFCGRMVYLVEFDD